MHPVEPNGPLTYSLEAITRGESSFPERHIWTESDDITHLPANDVTYSQPGFPKLDTAFGGAPGLSSFWQQNWLDQTQTLLHRNPVSFDCHNPQRGGGVGVV